MVTFHPPFLNSNHKEEVCALYVRDNLYIQSISTSSDRKTTLLVRQLQQAGWITKDIVISEVPCEIRGLHYTREMKCKAKERCK